MKQKLGLFACLLFFLALACSTANNEEQSTHFLPSEKHLKEGIIHQYYITTKPKERNEDIRTDVQYCYYKKNQAGEITEQRFDPAFLLKEEVKYVQKGEQVHLLNKNIFWHGDTLLFEIGEQNALLCFDGSKCKSQSTRNYISGHTRSYEKEIHAVTDTVILNKAAKIITAEILVITTSPKAEVDSIILQSKEIYSQNLGLWSSTIDHPKYITEYILVEQLLPETFEQLAAHDIKRIGHIDFDKTLDREKDFTLCKAQEHIVDYYNGPDFEAGFPGRKKPLKAYINARLDSDKLHQESGFLTFRFVINCKGQAGRFTTDEIDFDYQIKQFHQETIQHLYEILASIPKWDISVIHDEAQDAYTYITFKLDNGTITELLP